MPLILWTGAMPLSRYVVALLLFLVACDGATDPGVRLINQVAIDRTRLVPGDTMRVSVTITNQTLHAVTVQGSGSCFVVFDVLDATGAVVYPRGRVCTADLVSQTFAPLTTVAIDFKWTGEEHIVENGILVRQPLAPGNYRIVGGLGAVRPQGQPSEGVEFELLASPSAP
jgi:hypothetical protein